MEIKDAILTLQTLSQNKDAEIGKLSNEKLAVDIAVLQLQGTLATNLTELDTANAQVADLEAQVATLEPAPVVDPTPMPVTTEPAV